MAENENTAEIVRRLAALVAEHGLTELSVEEAGLAVTVKGAPESVPATPLSGPAVPPLPPAHAHTPAYPQATVPVPADRAPVPSAPAASAGRLAMESPMVGVFYQAPSPDDPPFVSVGDVIRVGQPIGLIEAMKVYSEVPSDVAGRVVEIMVGNGTLVQQGQPLLYVEPA